MPVPAIIAAGAALFGTAMRGSQSRRNIQDQAYYNRQLAEYEYQKNLEMWNMQNEYNSPNQQMARLKEAGLNPNMVYGQGVAGATGQAKEMPKYQQDQVDYSQRLPAFEIPQMISAYQDIRMKNAQIDNMEEQNKIMKIEQELRANKSLLTLRQAAKEKYSAGIKGIEAQLAQFGFDYKKQEIQEKLRQLQLGNELKQAQILFQNYENQWRSQGVTSHDHYLIRIIVRMMMENGINPSERIGELMPDILGKVFLKDYYK